MPTLTDKIIREVVDSFENHPIVRSRFNEGEPLYGVENKDHVEQLKSFLETKLRQMAEEIKKELTIAKYNRDKTAFISMVKRDDGIVFDEVGQDIWDLCVDKIEELKKSI